jgi:hypothetical protein
MLFAERGKTMNKELIFGSLFAAALMAGCNQPGGGNVSSLRKGDAQSAMTAPAPTPPAAQPATVQQAQTVITQMVEATRIVEVTVAVPVQVVVTATPEPGIEAECGYMAILDPLDDADRAAGVVQRGHMQPCAYATAKAMGVLP